MLERVTPCTHHTSGGGGVLGGLTHFKASICCSRNTSCRNSRIVFVFTSYNNNNNKYTCNIFDWSRYAMTSYLVDNRLIYDVLSTLCVT